MLPAPPPSDAEPVIVFDDAPAIDPTPSQVVLISEDREDEESVSSAAVLPSGEEDPSSPAIFLPEDSDS